MTKSSATSTGASLKSRDTAMTLPNPTTTEGGGTGKRSVPEWIGATPDTKVPPRVVARIFLAYGGRCYLSKRKITPADKWDLDHIKALANGGENRESNLAPALRDKHREKTKDDRGEQSKTERTRAKHLGIWPKPVRKIQSQGFRAASYRGTDR